MFDTALERLAERTSAAFFDYDRDGKLDLAVVNYVDNDPSWFCKSQSDSGRDYCSPNVFPAR